jgi:Tol biopolymer transport system component
LSKPLLGLAALLLNAHSAVADIAAGALSPDRRYTVFEKAVAGGTQLWLHDHSRDQQRALVRLPGDNRHAVWSPDSLFVAFCATFKHRHFITVTDLTGHSWLIAEISGRCSTPAWSADAVWLAFSGLTTFGDYDVFQATAGGTEHQNISNVRDVDEGEPRWDVGTKSFTYQLVERVVR